MHAINYVHDLCRGSRRLGWTSITDCLKRQLQESGLSRLYRDGTGMIPRGFEKTPAQKKALLLTEPGSVDPEPVALNTDAARQEERSAGA